MARYVKSESASSAVAATTVTAAWWESDSAEWESAGDGVDALPYFGSFLDLIIYTHHTPRTPIRA